MTTILLVRHGQSEWNAQDRWQGRADPDLSDLGVQQARMAANNIGSVDLIIASNLSRATQTALIISETIGTGPVITNNQLVERDLGEWTGLTRSEIFESHPDWEESGFRPKGWEHDDDITKRAVDAILAIAEEYEGATILAVTHGGLIVSMETYLGVNKHRPSNLDGRVIHVEQGVIKPGDSIRLIRDELITGGSSMQL